MEQSDNNYYRKAVCEYAQTCYVSLQQLNNLEHTWQKGQAFPQPACTEQNKPQHSKVIQSYIKLCNHNAISPTALQRYEENCLVVALAQDNYTSNQITKLKRIDTDSALIGIYSDVV